MCVSPLNQSSGDVPLWQSASLVLHPFFLCSFWFSRTKISVLGDVITIRSLASYWPGCYIRPWQKPTFDDGDLWLICCSRSRVGLRQCTRIACSLATSSRFLNLGLWACPPVVVLHACILQFSLWLDTEPTRSPPLLRSLCNCIEYYLRWLWRNTLLIIHISTGNNVSCYCYLKGDPLIPYLF